MKAFCSFLFCLSKGSVQVADRHESCNDRESEQAADGHGHVKTTNGIKERPESGFISPDGGTAVWTRDGAVVDVARGRHNHSPSANGRLQTAAATDLLRNERTLRVLLQRAKLVLSEQSQLYSIDRVSSLPTTVNMHWSKETLSNPELLKLNTQLMEACNAPRPDGRALLQVELLLGEARRWLGARPCPASATAVLYTLGEGLAHAEHAVRSGGQVRFWQSSNVAAFLALLQLQADLLVQASRAAQLQRRQSEQDAQAGREQGRGQGQPHQRQGQPRGRSDDVTVEADDQMIPLQQQPQQHQGHSPGLPRQHPLTFAAAALLLRPEWLDLLAEALDLLHFSEEYRVAALRAGREPQEALAAALLLWSFLTQLVKFAAAHADSVQRMGACLQRLASLLTPPAGAVPRLLALPLEEGSLVAQLHALWLLQVLYDMPDAKVLYSPALADHYVGLHHHAMVQYYQASAADPNSASAELCRIHATLLRSLARHPGLPVRAAFARAGTVEWILGEVSLESQLLSAAQQDGGDAVDPDVCSHDDDEDDEVVEETVAGDSDSAGSSRSGSSPRRRPLVCEALSGEAGGGGDQATAVAPGDAARNASGKNFAFTYDLNEDVERLIALEDELGHDVELDGFEYDEEGKQLKARSEARQASAAAAAAASEPQRAAVAQMPQQQQDAAPAVAATVAATPPVAVGGFGLRSPSQKSGNVPRLALMGLRSASINSLHVSSPAGQPPRHHPGFRQPSNTGSGCSGRTSEPLRCISACLEEADEEAEAAGHRAMEGPRDWLEEAPTPTAEDPAVAAAAAERVASWSSSLVEAYATAASGGDVTRVPYPPPRTRSAVSAEAAAAAAAAVANSGVRPPSPKPAAAVASGDAAPAGRPREVTTASAVHAGPQGELHLMVTCSASTSGRSGQNGPNALAHGRPPLPAKPALPPLRVASGSLAAEPSGAASAALPALSPTTSARAPPLGSSRAMVMLSASNRARAMSPTGSQQPPSPSQLQGQHSQIVTTPTGAGAGTAGRDLSRQSSSFNDAPLSAPAAAAETGATDAAAPSGRPPGPLIPALNLKSLRRRDGGGPGPTTDTGRTAPLSSLLRATNAGGGSSLSNCSGMDSANTLLPTCSSAVTASSAAAASTSYGTAAAGPVGAVALHCIAETAEPPELTYQDLACQRLLYQDRSTHVLLLKTLMDLLVAPSGALDPAYVPQHPANSGAPHAEFILLWHLNAPRNNIVVHELCRGAQRRAKQAAAERRADTTSPLAAAAPVAPAAAPGGRPISATSAASQTLSPKDSARDHPAMQRQHHHHQQQQQAAAVEQEAAAAAAAVAAQAPNRAAAITRALQLLSRPLFDAGRYSNLQFVARGTFGDVFRARMDPPRAQAWPSPAPSHANSLIGAGVAAGAGGEVGAAAGCAGAGVLAQSAAMQVVIKTIQLPSSAFDPCVLADVFSEISVMEKFKGHDCICQLLDYGMRDDAYWIIMRRYRCSLAEWRARQRPLGSDNRSGSGSGSGAIANDTASGSRSASSSGADDAAAPAATAALAARVYLSALSQIVEALKLLASQHVVHFDLKCSNVLIEPLPGVRDGELWAPVDKLLPLPPASAATVAAAGSSRREAATVPFRCVLADFGEARAYRCAEEAFTARNRGTEVFKSPEMLLLNAAASERVTAAAASIIQPQQEGVAAAMATPSSATLRHHHQHVSFGASPASASSRPQSARTAAGGGPPRHPALAGAGLASDVWSLGCLAYELLSGTVLFGGDYASVTHRVAFGTGEHLSLTAAERARLGNLPHLVTLVEWILARDPSKRPSLEQIQERIVQVRTALAGIAAA